MPLLNVMRLSIQASSTAAQERLTRFVAERAREDADTNKWSTRISTGAEGRAISYVSVAENFVDLLAREQPDEMIRRLFGEGDGNAILESAQQGVVASSQVILSPREDLGGPVGTADTSVPLALVTRIRVTPGGALGCEELIRKVLEAVSKSGQERRYMVLQPTIGQQGSYTVVQSVTDAAQLDGQGTVPELLAEAFGAKEAEKIFREGTACIQEAQTELSVLREDLSNL